MSDNIPDFFLKRNPNIHTVFGTISLSLGCAFVGNYNFDTAFSNINSAATLISFILTNPYIGIIIGALSMIIGATSNHFIQHKLQNENDSLKIEKSDLQAQLRELNSLREKISEYQEDGHQLKVENYKLHEKQVETWLKGICKHIELDYESRVSIYYKDGNVFKLLARNSSNPLLKQFNRKDYPIECGVLSKAWQYGYYADANIPEDFDAYIEYMCKKYQYIEEVLYNIKMKSCTMLGLAIVDADENIGVILFESKEQNAFEEGTIEAIKKYCSDFQSHLSGFVRDCKVYERLARTERTAENTQTHRNIIEELGGTV
ncbi:prominin family protein [Aeromonas veronii]|uniref:prominin family protein n=1 Tax=Aeromonas veronii TaxID=654 RepID=UPI001F1CA5BF|nr:prominin family protein [Aeromonas veronii]MCF5891078.1 prominin family protein [Aeromonas veronii]